MPDHQSLGEVKAQATRQFIARRLLPQKCMQQAEMGEKHQMECAPVIVILKHLHTESAFMKSMRGENLATFSSHMYRTGETLLA
jgi:hypothetical protein